VNWRSRPSVTRVDVKQAGAHNCAELRCGAAACGLLLATRMKRAAILVGVGVMTLGASAVASAEEPMLFGARIGGYGFRQAPNAQSQHTGWTDCRMNGIGLFAERGLGAYFVEAGLDAYFADELGTGGHEHEVMATADEWRMDRVSGLASVSGGVRFLRGARVSPYLQVGLGVELTRVALLDAAGTAALEDSFVLPTGFIGFGGDLRLGAARVGMNVRVHAMGHFDHGPGIDGFAPETELAAQAQFYAKFPL
jgi:hypothetical protein